MPNPNRRVRCFDTGSEPGDYRWLLESDLLDATGPALVVVQMNPSTASETRSDSTVGKVEAWARANNFRQGALHQPLRNPNAVPIRNDPIGR